MDSATLAARLKARSTKTIALPASGGEVVIRKVNQLDFARRGGGILAALQSGERSWQDVPLEERADLIQIMLDLCLARPRLWTGDPDECPEDRVTLSDLQDDLLRLVSEILAFNGLTPEVAQATTSFRGTVRAGTGPDRETLPGAADGDPAPRGVGAEPAAGDR